jgi:hypothetical protein
MEQTALWYENFFDAIGAAVQAAGGTKRVAGKLWPTLDQTTAAARLRGCLNVDHAQKLDPDELLAISRLAREAGDNSIMEFQARELGYELKPLAPEEAKKRVKRVRRLALLEELKRLEDEE